MLPFKTSSLFYIVNSFIPHTYCLSPCKPRQMCRIWVDLKALLMHIVVFAYVADISGIVCTIHVTIPTNLYYTNHKLVSA